MRSLAVLACVAVATLAAGCSSSPSSNATVDPGTAPTSAATGAWAAEEFTGEFTTTALVDAESAAQPHLVTVPNGSKVAWLNGTLAGAVPDGMQVRFIPSGCNQSDCFEEAAAPSGAFSIEVQEPDGGDWSVVFFADTAAQSGSYTIEVNAFVTG